MNGQIQYARAGRLTFHQTRRMGRRPRLADPSRFCAAVSTPTPLTFTFLGAILLAAVLAAVPHQVPRVAVATVLGGAWLSLVLAMTLPNSSERAGAELERRLAEFRHALNAVGDDPTRAALEALLQLASGLGLREEEITIELQQVRASLDALTLREQIHRGHVPIVANVEFLPSGDDCHFLAPVRFGRRHADQVGHLLLTSSWVKFRGGTDVSVTWAEVALVQRAGREIILSLEDSRRILRFCCATIDEAARGSVIAEHLAQLAHGGYPDSSSPLYQAGV